MKGRRRARFRDRRDAGISLAAALARYADDRDVVVLGIPRGGVAVAYEVARALGAPLDTFEVRKLGVPGHEELAMGAIGSGGALALNREVIDSLEISPEEVERVQARERQELERREKLFRDGRSRPELAGKTVILVDDGIATGASISVAIEALRQHAPRRIVVAVPVAPREIVATLRRAVDNLVCAGVPEPFVAVGAAYDDFRQVTDDEVRALLERRLHDPFTRGS